MANIFISYGDARYYESVRRVSRQARKMDFFDKVIAYDEHALPNEVTMSPLFQYKRGGGYWLWKPWIILETMKNSKSDDVIFYVDAGCSLNGNSKEWAGFFQLMENHSGIFFQYRDADTYPAWAQVCSNEKNYSSKIKHWTKPLCRRFLQDYFASDSHENYRSLWAGACVIKNDKYGVSLVQEWFEMMYKHPEIVRDMEGDELMESLDYLNAHRHDQAILTSLVYYRKDYCNLIVIPETSESQKEKAAIRADRFIQKKMSPLLYLKYRIMEFVNCGK